MSEYANGSATPLNMLHAAYAFGACVAPLAVLACQKLGGDNGWRLALEISQSFCSPSALSSACL